MPRDMTGRVTGAPHAQHRTDLPPNPYAPPAPPPFADPSSARRPTDADESMTYEVPEDAEVPAMSQAAASAALGAVELGLMLRSRYGAEHPRVEVDDRMRRQILLLAQIHCTYEEISAVTEIAVDELWHHARDLIELGKSRGKASLRRRQFQKALDDGNVNMLVWLGKNVLGQTDRAVATLEANTNVNTNAGAGPDGMMDVEAEAESVMTELRTRLDTIRRNREESTERAEEARRQAAHGVPVRETPIVDPERVLPPAPVRTQQEAHARRGFMSRPSRRESELLPRDLPRRSNPGSTDANR